MEQPAVIGTVKELRAQVRAWRAEGLRVALVPTMGALHDGHLSLCRLGLTHAHRLIVSIFVNPKQFAPSEDFATYPRPFEADVAKLASVFANAVFAPPAAEMYPDGAATSVRVGGPALELEAVTRPTHFEGVATVVTKLLLQAQPDVAVFGEKDYQQLQVIRRLVADLDLPVEIKGGPTLREADGLAMSSRNVYLAPAERRIAPRLLQTLQAAAFALRDGAVPEDAVAAAKATLEQVGFRVDYVELRDAASLATITELRRSARLLVAARLGRTRLIDNIAVDPH